MTIFKKAFLKIVLFGIIFLTGCARTGYHRFVSPDGLGTPERASPASFIWPLERPRLKVPFGEREDRVSVKGIVIESRAGTEVVAARDGRVVFIDEKMRGYGKTVILEHGDDFSTVYALNSEILVKIGQGVRQGEVIARAGQAGPDRPGELYFEIRRGAHAENPLSYLSR